MLENHCHLNIVMPTMLENTASYILSTSALFVFLLCRIQASPPPAPKKNAAWPVATSPARPRRSNTRTSHCARWAQAAATAACKFKLSSRNVAYLIGLPNLWMPRVMCTHACVIAIPPMATGHVSHCPLSSSSASCTYSNGTTNGRRADLVLLLLMLLLMLS